MFEISTLIAIIIYATILGVALRSQKSAWMIAAIAIVLSILVGRELSIDFFEHFENARLSEQGVLSQEYKDGMSYFMILVQKSGPYVFLLYLIVFALFVKGVRDQNQKRELKADTEQHRY